jgi:hypothetical protein
MSQSADICTVSRKHLIVATGHHDIEIIVVDNGSLVGSSDAGWSRLYATCNAIVRRSHFEMLGGICQGISGRGLLDLVAESGHSKQRGSWENVSAVVPDAVALPDQTSALPFPLATEVF